MDWTLPLLLESLDELNDLYKKKFVDGSCNIFFSSKGHRYSLYMAAYHPIKDNFHESNHDLNNLFATAFKYIDVNSHAEALAVIGSTPNGQPTTNPKTD